MLKGMSECVEFLLKIKSILLSLKSIFFSLKKMIFVSFFLYAGKYIFGKKSFKFFATVLVAVVYVPPIVEQVKPEFEKTYFYIRAKFSRKKKIELVDLQGKINPRNIANLSIVPFEKEISSLEKEEKSEKITNEKKESIRKKSLSFFSPFSFLGKIFECIRFFLSNIFACIAWVWDRLPDKLKLFVIIAIAWWIWSLFKRRRRRKEDLDKLLGSGGESATTKKNRFPIPSKEPEEEEKRKKAEEEAKRRKEERSSTQEEILEIEEQKSLEAFLDPKESGEENLKILDEKDKKGTTSNVTEKLVDALKMEKANFFQKNMVRETKQCNGISRASTMTLLAQEIGVPKSMTPRFVMAVQKIEKGIKEYGWAKTSLDRFLKAKGNLLLPGEKTIPSWYGEKERKATKNDFLFPKKEEKKKNNKPVFSEEDMMKEVENEEISSLPTEKKSPDNAPKMDERSRDLHYDIVLGKMKRKEASQDMLDDSNIEASSQNTAVEKIKSNNAPTPLEDNFSNGTKKNIIKSEEETEIKARVAKEEEKKELEKRKEERERIEKESNDLEEEIQNIQRQIKEEEKRKKEEEEAKRRKEERERIEKESNDLEKEIQNIQKKIKEEQKKIKLCKEREEERETIKEENERRNKEWQEELKALEKKKKEEEEEKKKEREKESRDLEKEIQNIRKQREKEEEERMEETQKLRKKKEEAKESIKKEREKRKRELEENRKALEKQKRESIKKERERINKEWQKELKALEKKKKEEEEEKRKEREKQEEEERKKRKIKRKEKEKSEEEIKKLQEKAIKVKGELVSALNGNGISLSSNLLQEAQSLSVILYENKVGGPLISALREQISYYTKVAREKFERKLLENLSQARVISSRSEEENVNRRNEEENRNIRLVGSSWTAPIGNVATDIPTLGGTGGNTIDQNSTQPHTVPGSENTGGFTDPTRSKFNGTAYLFASGANHARRVSMAKNTASYLEASTAHINAMSDVGASMGKNGLPKWKQYGKVESGRIRSIDPFAKKTVPTLKNGKVVFEEVLDGEWNRIHNQNRLANTAIAKENMNKTLASELKKQLNSTKKIIKEVGKSALTNIAMDMGTKFAGTAISCIAGNNAEFEKCRRECKRRLEGKRGLAYLDQVIENGVSKVGVVSIEAFKELPVLDTVTDGVANAIGGLVGGTVLGFLGPFGGMAGAYLVKRAKDAIFKKNNMRQWRRR